MVETNTIAVDAAAPSNQVSLWPEYKALELILVIERRIRQLERMVCGRERERVNEEVR